MTIIAGPTALWLAENKIPTTWALDTKEIVAIGLTIGLVVTLTSLFVAWVYRFYIKSSNSDYATLRQSLTTGFGLCATLLSIVVIFGYFKIKEERQQTYNERVAFATKAQNNNSIIDTQLAPIASHEINLASATHADPRLDAVITAMEKSFPELNPYSQHYYQRETDIVISRWKELQNSGMSEYDALWSSREEYMTYKVNARSSKVVREIDANGNPYYHN